MARAQDVFKIETMLQANRGITNTAQHSANPNCTRVSNFSFAEHSKVEKVITMRRAQLPISALPVWSKLNDVSFLDIDVRVLGAKGYGLATERALTSKEETFDIPALLLVPQDLILSREAIKEHAKVDHHFRQLLNVAGGKVFLF
jgi:hypothetical protein